MKTPKRSVSHLACGASAAFRTLIERSDFLAVRSLACRGTPACVDSTRD
jgi:hypothetical protein